MKLYSVLLINSFLCLTLFGCSSLSRRPILSKIKRDISSTARTDQSPALDTLPDIDKSIISADIEITPQERDDLKKVSKSIHNIPVEMNRDVRKWIDYFSQKDRDRFQRFLNRGAQYREIVENVLEENGLPGELYYLAMIESGYQNHATSRASAVGVWQFIRGTGKRYGLVINRYIDERRDPIRATEAAVRYLRDLYNVFGSWHLAMAGYNAGEYRVVRSIFRSKTRNFWELVRKKSLPRETRNYIPKFLAAVEIGSNPEKYGFTTPQPDHYPDLRAVNVPGPLSLKTVAQKTGVPLRELIKVNPHLTRKQIPSSNDGYDIWVPIPFVAHIEKFKIILAKIAKRNYSRKTIASSNSKKIHTVRSGENLSTIASRYGLAVSYLRRLNNLKSDTIFPGMKLELTTRTYRAGNAKYYVVKRGDNLSSIAQRFELSVSALKQLNGLRSSKIYIGSRLKISARSISYYRVKRGDNLTFIAKKFGMSVYELKKINGLRTNRIYTGARLKVSNVKFAPSQLIKYKVQRGDNLSRIAQKFDSSIRSLKNLNDLNGYRIFPGQVLLVKR